MWPYHGFWTGLVQYDADQNAKLSSAVWPNARFALMVSFLCAKEQIQLGLERPCILKEVLVQPCAA
jgi:hypothetical protein